jgi:integrase/ribosomal protein L40E
MAPKKPKEAKKPAVKKVVPEIEGFIAKKKKDENITPAWETNLRKILTQFTSYSKKKPSAWTQTDIDGIFGNLRNGDRKQNYQRNLIGHGKAFCKFLAKTNKKIDLSEIDSVRTPGVVWKTKKPADMLTPAEVETTIKAARSIRDKCFIAMLFDTSCRPNEVLSLKWGDLIADKYGYYFSTSGKTGKERHIRLTTVSIPYLEQLRSTHPDPTDKNPVFVATGKGSIQGFSMENVSRIVKDIRERTGIKKLKPSIFRPSRITLDVKNHVDRSYIQYKNWGSLKSPMIDLYTNIGTDYLDETALRAAGMERKSTEKPRERKVELPVCPSCGTVNPFDTRFCRVCNKPMDGTEDPTVKTMQDQMAKMMAQMERMQKEIDQREVWFHMPGTAATGADDQRKPGIGVHVLTDEEANDLKE